MRRMLNQAAKCKAVLGRDICRDVSSFISFDFLPHEHDPLVDPGKLDVRIIFFLGAIDAIVNGMIGDA